MSEFFTPFPNIPFDRHYEGALNPNLLNPQSTVLFTDLEKGIMQDSNLLQLVESRRMALPSGLVNSGLYSIENYQLVAGLFSKKVDHSQEAWRAIDLQCQGDYPTNYQTLHSFLDFQAENTTSPAGYQDFLRKLDSEYQIPEYVRLFFHFQDHVIGEMRNFERIKDKLVERVSGVFVKGENNVYFGEDAKGFMGGNNDFKRRFQQMGSYRRAVMYPNAYREAQLHLKRKPNEEEVDEEIQRANKWIISGRATNDHEYAMAEEVAVDYFIGQGYKVSVEHERGNTKNLPPQIKSHPRSLGAFKDMFYAIRGSSWKRNGIIAGQLKNIVAQAEYAQEKTNIFVLLGTHHQPIINDLPFGLRQVTDHKVLDRTITTQTIADLQNKLMRNEEVSKELWESAYQDYLAGNIL